MVRQNNMFTGKVDILTDPNDDPAKIALALHDLGEKAGKVVKQRTTPPPVRIQAPTNQTNLF